METEALGGYGVASCRADPCNGAYLQWADACNGAYLLWDIPEEHAACECIPLPRSHLSTS
jgi:hypothetical protein